MKKIQSFFKYSLFALLVASAFYSCEDDDICTDEGEVPRMVADMYYNGTDVKLEDSIYYWAYVLKDSIPTNTSKDTVQIENGVVLNKSSFGIALRNNPNKKVFYTIAQGPDRYIRDSINNNQITDTIFAKRDRLILEYDEIGNAYTSKACGYGLTFKGIKVALVTKKGSGPGNWIKSIETVNTEIKDGSTTVIKLFTDERN
ncbi:DUF6452 family protein [Algoriella sp.]|uniref:DUF6452 family protein n=1 Tax=Algoriella sp. TaxID=1872434 RepID=UPI001B100B01|nr:DUF6452 family protein [Algoriella sp.]MBO6211822.1 hypothetical protein [Algoriella sp.]